MSLKVLLLFSSFNSTRVKRTTNVKFFVLFVVFISTMIKSSVFANKKISSGLTASNSSSTSSSLFENSLQQANGRFNWQATPTNSRRLIVQSLLQPSHSSTSLRNQQMPPTVAISNTPTSRPKPLTLSGLVETLNEVRLTISSLDDNNKNKFT